MTNPKPERALQLVTDEEAINETARFWIRTYMKAREESNGTQYAAAIARYTAQLFCPHTHLRRVNKNVYCDTCGGMSTDHTPP